MKPSILPDTRHQDGKIQLPIEAVKIFLDLAVNIMYNNDGITEEDWKWFYVATVDLSSIAWQRTISEKV